MAKLAAIAKDEILRILQDASTGLNQQLGAIENRDAVILPRVAGNAWFEADIPDPLLQGTFDAPLYPIGLVYLGESENQNLQKFSYFSGVHEIVVEFRHSVEGPEGLTAMEQNLDRFAEAVINVIQANKAKLAGNLQYNGHFSVTYSPVQEGGVGLYQAAFVRVHLLQHQSQA